MVALGFETGRLKTGTPPRVNGRTLDFAAFEEQPGDDPPRPFSYAVQKITQPQMPCWITYTNAHTHELVQDNLARSAMYSGRIEGIGPRYCPSIEDKIARFADKERHQVFVEPEGRRTLEFYSEWSVDEPAGDPATPDRALPARPRTGRDPAPGPTQSNTITPRRPSSIRT